MASEGGLSFGSGLEPVGGGQYTQYEDMAAAGPPSVPRSEPRRESLPSLLAQSSGLTDDDVARLRRALQGHNEDSSLSFASNFTEFQQTTHGWMIFQDHPRKTVDRCVGTFIIAFQLFTYALFTREAIEDYEKGLVWVGTSHANCLASGEAPDEGFTCEAEVANALDAVVAFVMLGIFLASDIQQAFRSMRKAPSRAALFFATLAGLEVLSAFLAAAVTVSQKIYVGQAVDAVEAGVGLLFIRELGTRAYHGIRQKERKQFITFFVVLIGTVALGLMAHPICKARFAPS